MMINVLFFGPLSDITGTKYVELNDVMDAQGLNSYIIEQYPELKTQRYQIAVNQQLVQDNIILAPGDEVAFLPPYAGG